jgi:GH15 family glucan-1,4-alpha-glucosidase
MYVKKKMVKSGQRWSNLVKDGQIWSNLVKDGQIWSFSNFWRVLWSIQSGKKKYAKVYLENLTFMYERYP